MAFSTSQEQYIKSIVAPLLDEFPDGGYVAWNTLTSNTEYSKSDLHIVFAKDGLVFDSTYLDEYHDGALFLSTFGQSIQYDVITSNVSSYNSDFTSRVSVSVLSESDSSVAVPTYNTISSNADFNSDVGIGYPLVGDYINSVGVDYYVTDSQLQTTALGVIGLLILFTVFFSWVFGKR